MKNWEFHHTSIKILQKLGRTVYYAIPRLKYQKIPFGDTDKYWIVGEAVLFFYGKNEEELILRMGKFFPN